MNLIYPYHVIESEINGEEILKHLEICGRVCYKSEDKITSDSSQKMIKHLLTNQHLSVIEHFNLTVRFITDRGVTHELVRHRLASFSQESTRYINYSKKGCAFIIPWNIKLKECEINVGYPELYDRFSTDTLLSDEWAKIWIMSMKVAENSYNRAIELSVSPQDARSVLPDSTKTEIIITANMREWRHILDLRCGPKAHPEMQRLMLPLLDELSFQIPVLFDDLVDKYNSQSEKWRDEIERRAKS